MGGVGMFLEISQVEKYYGSGENRVQVLKGITTGVEKGAVCVLLGPSGSGKSTLLNIIGGIESAEAGSISIDGERIGDMNERRLSLYRRNHLGYVFQFYNLIPNLTVKENIEVGAYLRRAATANLHRPRHCEKPGYLALRRAHRCAGL